MATEATRAFEVELNPEQRAAVEHGDGPLLVVAGAGTGKTRVIIERIRYLLESKPELSGENILGLTFTEKAAAEMTHRVVQTVGERAKEVWLGTFHSFCLEKILKEVNPELEVLDEFDHWILLRRNIAALGLDRFKRLTEPGQFLNDFVKFFSRCQDELVTADDYARHAARLRATHNAQRARLEPEAQRAEEEELARQEELARAYRVSEELLRQKNMVTFGGQILQAVEKLRDDAELLERVRARYLYILVDEFQDTNIAQLELLWLLAGQHRNIVAVGDDDQAIYRFRGASFGSFTIFLDRFCAAGKGGAATRNLPIVSLTRNLRSTGHILKVASAVIQHNEKSPLLPVKRLIPQHTEGDKIRIVEFSRPIEEAHWIATEIERLRGPGQPWRSFAVLYRKHSHRDRLIEVLRHRRIPFVIRKYSILSSTLLRDLLAYLRLIAQASDNVSCARVVAAPYWRFEPQDLHRLAERAGKKKGISLSSALDAAQSELPFEKDGPRAAELAEFLGGLRERAKKITASAFLEDLIRSLGLAPLASDADRLYLARFVRFVEEWEKKSEGKALRDLIQHFHYFAEAGGEIYLEEEPADDGVQLMTVHGAKGLEFPHVFVIELSSGDFPARPRAPVFEFPVELMKEEKPKGDFRIQEERRLFYVALTRARRHLTLTAVINKRKKPSPFLDDILSEARIKDADTVQMAPEVSLPPVEEATGSPPLRASRPQLFGPGPADSRAYSQIALWAKAYHPPQPEPLQLSASAIETYQSCPMKYLFQQVWGIHGGPRAAMTFGNVMHTTICEFVNEIRKGREVPFKEVAGIFKREWSDAGFLDDYQEEEYRRAGLEQLEKFCASYRAFPAEVLHQEKNFELPVESDVIITGRIDQINRLSKREVEIVDYKTGKPRQPKDAKESLQLSLYALAATEILDLVPERLVFYNLTTNEAVEATRDAKSLSRAKEAVAEVADLIRAREFPAKPGFLCRYCDYKPLCPAHEQLISISAAQA